MIIVEKNVGTKIDYEIQNTATKKKITFDDDLQINLAKRVQDWPVHIDVCFDADGELVIGTAAGRAYVAEIDIPARRYERVPDEDYMIPYGDGSGGDGTIDGEEHYKTVPVPLDMDTVTLTLWAID